MLYYIISYYIHYIILESCDIILIRALRRPPTRCPGREQPGPRRSLSPLHTLQHYSIGFFQTLFAIFPNIILYYTRRSLSQLHTSLSPLHTLLRFSRGWVRKDGNLRMEIRCRGFREPGSCFFCSAQCLWKFCGDCHSSL